MTHPLESVVGETSSHHRFCECRRHLGNMSATAVKKHLESELHARWMNWDEHTREVSKKRAERLKAKRATNAYKEYDARRLATDRAEGYRRQLEWKAEVVECECGRVVTKRWLAEHRKSKLHHKSMGTVSHEI